MDYTKQIFNMLGVEPEEEFYLKNAADEKLELTYRINKNLYLQIKTDTAWIPSNRQLHNLLCGDCRIVKIPHPTAEEQLAIDYARACGYKWIAKDKNKTVAAFKEKPKKGTKEWLNTTNDLDDWIELYLPISFLSWEDEEPYYIGD